MSKVVVFLGFIFSFVFSAVVMASPADGEKILSEARSLYSQRENLGRVADLILLLKSSDTIIEESAPLTKFELRLIFGKAFYTQGTHSPKSERIPLFNQSMDEFKKAKAAGDYAEAYYWYAAALGRWAETKGMLASLDRKDELMSELNGAIARKSVTGAPGESVEGFGPQRVLGRMYALLPKWKDGDRKVARERYEYAYKNAPLFPMNVMYRAELLSTGSAEDKAEACSSLDKILALDPKTLIPDRILENTEEFEQLSKLKNQICK